MTMAITSTLNLNRILGDSVPDCMGEAIWGPYVAFGCVGNGDERYLDADGNPLVAEGILVLTALDEHGDVAESIKYAPLLRGHDSGVSPRTHVWGYSCHHAA